MGKQRVYYLSYYDTEDGDRVHALSCTNKMNYIIDVLNKLGYEVEIISAAYTKERSFSLGKYRRIKDQVYLKTFLCTRYGNGISRRLQRILINFQLKKYIKKLNPSTPIIIYHSLGYINLYRDIKKRMKKVILEVEEVYTDVSQCKLSNHDKELSSINGYSDCFLFPTSVLNNLINSTKKPYSIIHGVYCSEPRTSNRFNDGRVHIVYAGTFDRNKGGAFIAIEAAYRLTDNYHLHILGFGDDEDTKKVIEEVKKANKNAKCIVTYEGIKIGEEFNGFLQKCHIGLSSQNKKGAFNDTSFPSKILTYLSNGLKVVSVRIPVVEYSKVSNLITFYDEQKAESIANAIISISESDFSRNYSEELLSLEKNFTKELQNLL